MPYRRMDTKIEIIEQPSLWDKRRNYKINVIYVVAVTARLRSTVEKEFANTLPALPPPP